MRKLFILVTLIALAACGSAGASSVYEKEIPKITDSEAIQEIALQLSSQEREYFNRYFFRNRVGMIGDKRPVRTVRDAILMDVEIERELLELFPDDAYRRERFQYIEAVQNGLPPAEKR